MSNVDSNRYADRDPDAIERDLDATRMDLQATLGALERRLSLDHLLDLTVGRIREHGGQMAGNLGSAVTQNPVPMLLTTLGLAWLMLESRRGHFQPGANGTSEAGSGAFGRMSDSIHDAFDSSRDGIARARDSMSGATDAAREGIAGAAEAARDRMAGAADAARASADRAREQVDRAKASFDRMLEEQPLVLGAIGVAVGALVGALMPMSETEDRWLGDARESAMRAAAKAARTPSEPERGGNGSDATDEDDDIGAPARGADSVREPAPRTH